MFYEVINQTKICICVCIQICTLKVPSLLFPAKRLHLPLPTTLGGSGMVFSVSHSNFIFIRWPQSHFSHSVGVAPLYLPFHMLVIIPWSMYVGNHSGRIWDSGSQFASLISCECGSFLLPFPHVIYYSLIHLRLASRVSLDIAFYNCWRIVYILDTTGGKTQSPDRALHRLVRTQKYYPDGYNIRII